MHILLRDVQELEELVGEMHQAGTCDRLDMELLRTRISGVRHLLEAASGMKEVAGETPARPLPSVETPPPPPERIPRPDYTMPRAAPTPAAQVTAESPQTAPAEAAAPQTTPASQATPAAPAAPVTPSGQTAPQTQPTLVSSTPSSTGELRFEEPKLPAEGKPFDEDLFFRSPGPEEGKEVQHEKHTLGEKFTAGKSVHDLLMTEKIKSDLKFSNIPIPNLASAIGTNDKFLFTRELFEGNMEQFTDTIRQLDAMKNIREAVDFLQENFNWKKSETSHKFLELVKRRFL